MVTRKRSTLGKATPVKKGKRRAVANPSSDSEDANDAVNVDEQNELFPQHGWPMTATRPCMTAPSATAAARHGADDHADNDNADETDDENSTLLSRSLLRPGPRLLACSGQDIQISRGASINSNRPNLQRGKGRFLIVLPGLLSFHNLRNSSTSNSVAFNQSGSHGESPILNATSDIHYERNQNGENHNSTVPTSVEPSASLPAPTPPHTLGRIEKLASDTPLLKIPWPSCGHTATTTLCFSGRKIKSSSSKFMVLTCQKKGSIICKDIFSSVIVFGPGSWIVEDGAGNEQNAAEQLHRPGFGVGNPPLPIDFSKPTRTLHHYGGSKRAVQGKEVTTKLLASSTRTAGPFLGRRHPPTPSKATVTEKTKDDDEMMEEMDAIESQESDNSNNLDDDDDGSDNSSVQYLSDGSPKSNDKQFYNTRQPIGISERPSLTRASKAKVVLSYYNELVDGFDDSDDEDSENATDEHSIASSPPLSPTLDKPPISSNPRSLASHRYRRGDKSSSGGTAIDDDDDDDSDDLKRDDQLNGIKNDAAATAAFEPSNSKRGGDKIHQRTHSPKNQPVTQSESRNHRHDDDDSAAGKSEGGGVDSDSVANGHVRNVVDLITRQATPRSVKPPKRPRSGLLPAHVVDLTNTNLSRRRDSSNQDTKVSPLMTRLSPRQTPQLKALVYSEDSDDEVEEKETDQGQDEECESDSDSDSDESRYKVAPSQTISTRRRAKTRTGKGSAPQIANTASNGSITKFEINSSVAEKVQSRVANSRGHDVFEQDENGEMSGRRRQTGVQGNTDVQPPSVLNSGPAWAAKPPPATPTVQGRRKSLKSPRPPPARKIYDLTDDSDFAFLS